MPASQIATRTQRGAHGIDDRFGSGQAAQTRQPAGKVALLGVDDDHTTVTQGGDVGGRGRMGEHARVHGGRHDHWTTRRQRRDRNRIVRQTVCQLGQHVGRRRRNDDDVALAAECHMRNVGLHAGGPQVVEDRPMGDRLERQR